ncbi:MAG: hypothetical protein M3Q98_06645 [Actinomycetota bacterium]|nr:hypothetical protein [Actinomycetota bacterium]
MNETSGNERYRALRILALALCAALGFIGVALYFAMGTTEDGMANPPVWVPLAQVFGAFVILVLVETVGYRTAAAEGGDTQIVGNSSAMAYQSAMILRFALCESLAIVSIALAFVVIPNTFLTYVYGGLLSLALMLFAVVPNKRSLSKTEASLERDGRPSYLREAFDLAGSLR